ncbi:acyltransferase [Aeromicrobium phragmitis]|uniref:acyltransferase n=1 Tax=Aeromicrobium phragmitis TaxID=2478914 RepID=UPI00105C5017|nr:acyltransferase [Aeromicrobium phragmitis]
MGWYSRQELLTLGFRGIGSNVKVSTGSRLYRPERITIGDNSRVDDQTMITPGPSGSVTLGRNVYIGPACIIESPEDAVFEDFCTLAGRVTVYGATDDYLGESLTNPTVPLELRGLRHARIKIGRHAILGAHTVVLPGGELGEGTAVGAMSLVDKPLLDFGVYAGIPVRWVKERSRKLLALEDQLD